MRAPWLAIVLGCLVGCGPRWAWAQGRPTAPARCRLTVSDGDIQVTPRYSGSS